MKRLFGFLLCLVLVIGVTTPLASAAVVRLDNSISEKDNSYIETLFRSIKKYYGIEVFFVINYDYTGGEEFRNYARGFLEENSETGDAMIFAVSADNYYMNTRGKAGEVFNDDDIDVFYEAIADADESGEQYKAALIFYKSVAAILAERIGAPSKAETTSQKADNAQPQTEITTQASTDATAESFFLPGSVEIPDEIQKTRGDRLVDQADLLSEEDEDALQKKLDDISERLQFDVVIVTAEHIGTRSPMEFADDYFDYNGFGYGENFDGVCLLISMEDRDWWISTCGYGLTALSDDYFMKFISPSDFTYNLKNGDYSESFNFFADMVNRFVTEAKNGQPYSSEHRIHVWSYMKTGLIWSSVIGIIAAIIVTVSKNSNYTGFVHTKHEAYDYMAGGVNLLEYSDEFLYSHVYRERHEEPTSSSSGSSSSRASTPGTHTSSSGRSHGGGGGKF